VEEVVEVSDALSLKDEGNSLFKQQLFDKALETYSLALETCPATDTELRAILYSNRAACHLHSKQYESAISDCSEAIKEQPSFVKAYLRRFTANEQLEKWHDALSDINKALELDPTLTGPYGSRQKKAEQLSKELFEKEKDEMVGKLKDFGNFLLGKVGLSLDNFKVDQNKDTGSYNISFDQSANPKSDAGGSASSTS